ncbi:DUF805 domain-containing protein [Sphingomonas sp. ZT3P38]|uniref:DUF805 domain-containing protein n=1 Tax=Parasphingomonas zepuensis TaxID=3096161 RepID=UPI002FCCA329
MVEQSSQERLFNYKGRATRREMAAMVLATLVVLSASGVLFLGLWGVWIGDAVYSTNLTEALLARCIILLDLVPIGGCLATASRRLHDIGRSGLWLIAAIVPVAGTVLILVFLSLPGQLGRNGYGADPRSPDAAWLRRVFS